MISHAPTLRFGKYSAETIKRRQQFQSNLELKGQTAQDVFDSILIRYEYSFGNHNDAATLTPVLEKAIARSDKAQLLALDRCIFEKTTLIPDNLAMAIERRALALHQEELAGKGPHCLMGGPDPLEKVKADLALLG